MPEIVEEQTTDNGLDIVECCNCSNPSTRQSDDSTPYCDDCYEETFGSCYACDEETPIEDLREGTRDSQLFCETCWYERFTSCERCDCTVRQNDSYDVDGLSYCSECWSELYFHCDGCDEDCSQDDYAEDGYCQSCYDHRQEEEEGKDIHNYNYKPEPIFNGNGPLFAGVELEIECKSIQEALDAVHGSSALQKSLYMKHDGSLNDGFEIVSHPGDRTWWKAQKTTVETLLESLKTAKATSWDTDTCGMHIHLSKNQFTTLHVYKLLRFVYQNQDFMFRVSGRKSRDKLNRWASLNGSVSDAIRKAKYKNNDRYEAINLQNAATVEFRIFRGTLNAKRFYRNLEFTFALYEFTHQASIDGLTESAFCIWVEANRKSYREIAEYLHPAQRELITNTHVTETETEALAA